MIYVNTPFFMVMLAWSIFMPFICLFLGWWARDGEEKRA